MVGACQARPRKDMTMSEAEDFLALKVFDLAQEWIDRKEETLYRCPHHRRVKRVGCAQCIHERDEAKRLRAEARRALPASFLELL